MTRSTVLSATIWLAVFSLGGLVPRPHVVDRRPSPVKAETDREREDAFALRLFPRRDWPTLLERTRTLRISIPLAAAMAMQESSIRGYAVGWKIGDDGSYDGGMLQISSRNQQLFEEMFFDGEKMDVFDERQNLYAGLSYLRVLLDGRARGSITAALRLYNAGVGALERGSARGRDHAIYVLAYDETIRVAARLSAHADPRR